MENRKEVLIIIPAYNEEKTIVPVLEKLEQPEIAQIADVLVMNDASSDATNHVTKKRKHDVVTNVFNLGYGSGLQLGYKYAVRKDYCYVIQMDADGQHDVCNIPKIYETLQTRDANGASGYCSGFKIYGRKHRFPGISGEKNCICVVSDNAETGNRKKHF